MKFVLFYFGLLLTVIFGGQFIIQLVKTGDFYIVELGTSVIGLTMFSCSFFIEKEGEQW